MKDNCNKNCSNCNSTELPNISDTKEINIGYSYAYKTDCAGDRYIKAEEVKYLLKCERNKAIDDFIEKVKLKYLGVHPDELYEKYYPREICTQIEELAEQLKEGVGIGTYNQ